MRMDCKEIPANFLGGTNNSSGGRRRSKLEPGDTIGSGRATQRYDGGFINSAVDGRRRAHSARFPFQSPCLALAPPRGVDRLLKHS